jgi:MoaA/NifB/PqqE/SkfB family radical SAM enzyme
LGKGNTFNIWDFLKSESLSTQIAQKIIDNYSLNLIELYISDQCSLKCKHCFHGDIYSIDIPLSIQEWKTTIDKFILGGTKHFHLSGREPLNDSKTLSILKYLSYSKKFHPIKFGIISNGINGKKLFKHLNDLDIDYLEISIDGLEKSHNFLRGNNTYQYCITTLRTLVDILGVERVSTSSVLYQKNYLEVDQIIRTISSIGVNKLYFQPMSLFGSARYITELLLRPDQYAKTVNRIVQQLQTKRMINKGITIKFFIPTDILYEVCKSTTWLENILYQYIIEGTSTVKIGSNYLIFDFAIKQIPYWKQLIVTHDGYLIANYSQRSTFNYKNFSIGNIRMLNIEDIIRTAKKYALTSIIDYKNSNINKQHIVNA